jgi:anaerobic magnesium-protoporphyrin IX monomethyl ester cyclase
MKKVVLSTLNAKYIHTNLAIRCLKAYIEPEYEAEMAEYTIKDPILNIATDLFSKKPDIIQLLYLEYRRNDQSRTGVEKNPS